jgi:hypothetical protein
MIFERSIDSKQWDSSQVCARATEHEPTFAESHQLTVQAVLKIG